MTSAKVIFVEINMDFNCAAEATAGSLAMVAHVLIPDVQENTRIKLFSESVPHA
ncbi:MAG: hypothetical protein AAF431_11005 [Pseudomonadota bacterium]